MTNKTDHRLLSHAQVLEYLEKVSSTQNTSSKSHHHYFRHRNFIQEKVLTYLLACTPKVNDPRDRDELFGILTSHKRQRREDDENEDVSTSHVASGFGLTRAEAIQILNFMPTEHVELYTLLEDLPSRPDLENRMDELLETIARYRVDPGADGSASTDAAAIPVKQEEVEQEAVNADT